MNLTRSSHDLMPGFQATLVDAGYGQLLLRDAQGRVAQRWTMTQPKCILGASSSCQVCCPLPNIVDQHVLLVIGVKQVFLKALAPEVRLGGISITEHIHSDDSENLAFEIAGHRFEFQRYAAASSASKQLAADALSTTSSATTEGQLQGSIPGQISASTATASGSHTISPLAKGRLRFTVVRALEKKRVQPLSGLSEVFSGEPSAANSRPVWVEEIVRDALRPVEVQLESIQEPMIKLERELRRQQRRRRKQKAAATVDPSLPLISQATAEENSSAVTNASQLELRSLILEQSTQLETVNARVSEIASQLSVLENLMAEANQRRVKDSSQLGDASAEILQLQQEVLAAIQALQSQSLQAPPDQPNSASSERLQWRAEMENRLQDLGQSLAVLGDLKSQIGSLVEENRELARAWESRALTGNQQTGEFVDPQIDASPRSPADSVREDSNERVNSDSKPAAAVDNVTNLHSGNIGEATDLPNWWTQDPVTRQRAAQVPPVQSVPSPTAWDQETQPGRSEFAPDYGTNNEESAKAVFAKETTDVVTHDVSSGSVLPDQLEPSDDRGSDDASADELARYRRDLSDDALSVITNNAFSHDDYSQSVFSSDDLSLPGAGSAVESANDSQQELADTGFGVESWQAGSNTEASQGYDFGTTRDASIAPNTGLIRQSYGDDPSSAELETEDYYDNRNQSAAHQGPGHVEGYIEGRTYDTTTYGNRETSTEIQSRVLPDNKQEDSEESVEDYMRRLLARMRGVSEDEITLPGVDQALSAKTSEIVASTTTLITDSDSVSTASDTEKFASDATEPFDPDSYIPRGAAPERNRDLYALRELANSSARTAIKASARRKHGTDILIKAAVACVGLTAGVALVSINGFNTNIALIATIASFMVALIWGYDAIATLKPLIQSALPSNQSSFRSDTGNADDED